MISALKTRPPQGLLSPSEATDEFDIVGVLDRWSLDDFRQNSSDLIVALKAEMPWEHVSLLCKRPGRDSLSGPTPTPTDK
jgi:hypothetical protein